MGIKNDINPYFNWWVLILFRSDSYLTSTKGKPSSLPSHRRQSAWAGRTFKNRQLTSENLRNLKNWKILFSTSLLLLNYAIFWLWQKIHQLTNSWFHSFYFRLGLCLLTKSKFSTLHCNESKFEENNILPFPRNLRYLWITWKPTKNLNIEKNRLSRCMWPSGR